MADPLSALRDKKKDEAKPPAPKPKASAYPGDAQLLDVMGTLGGARRNPVPSGLQSSTASDPLKTSADAPPTALFRSPSPQSDTATHTVTAPPQQAIGGSESAASKLSTGPVSTEAGNATFEDMLLGEKVFVIAKRCFLRVSNPFCEVQGRILCTNYRMKFQNVKGGLREELKWMQDSKYFDIPLGTVEEVKIDTKTAATGVQEIQMRICCKDLRHLQFLMTTEEDCREVLAAVQSLGQPGNPTLLFAVKFCDEYRLRHPQESDSWTLYDPVQDYARMGVDTEIIPNSACPWKVSALNNRYELCPTYPSVLVLPKKMSDRDIRAVAGFRKRGRLPSLSWCGGHALNYASVWRCSQTTEGLMGSKSPEDESHVQCIRQGGKSQDRDLLVIDLRPWKAAWANKAGGGGFEGYQRCNLVFGGIDNIHCVRDAWRAMGAAVDKVIEGEVGSWIKDVANSGWYDYIGAIMRCAQMVLVEILTYKANVMVHCSDGWDRTAQTTSLSMLCIDPYYRTQAGFFKLIQKEWCAFGHKFRTRLALGEAVTGEYSPVFVQWLEAVYQVVIQYPTAFEFTPAVLLRLATEATTNRFGSFLTDCERERNQSVASHTLSMWSVLLEDGDSWRNPDYRPSPKPLMFSVSQSNYEVWEAYWFRYHPRGQKLRPVHPSAPFGTVVASNPLETTAAVPPLQPSSSTGPPLVPASKEERAPLPADPLALTPAPVAEKQLFTEEEISAPPKEKAMPTQLFQDDDDDDVFAKKK